VPYRLDYYASGEGDRQPAEIFEDDLMARAPRLLGKLKAVTVLVAETLPEQVRGGLLQKCRGYPDLYEIRTIFGNQLARYIVAKDGVARPPRLVLLGGLTKRPGQATPRANLDRAARHWTDYVKHLRVSPENPDEELDEPI
jgi:hypothetical protein